MKGGKGTVAEVEYFSGKQRIFTMILRNKN
jgi:hypothetical protein